MREMKLLVKKLNLASRAYYSESRSIMTDKQYDQLYDQLVSLEESTGIILANSPTKRVGYEVVSELKKITHTYPMLSLDKTKDPVKLFKWMGEKDAVLSYKMDGLTLVAYYDDHHLTQLVTRGNGWVGEDVTHNAPYISGLPSVIPYGDNLIVRGEAVISYKNFDWINQDVLQNGDEPYMNPRNLAASSIRLFDTEKTAKRCLQFMAFSLINPYMKEEPLLPDREIDCFSWLIEQGFDVVPHAFVTQQTVDKILNYYSNFSSNSSYPVDGLVLTYNQIDRSLGTTGKYPRYSIAFKWADDTVETILKQIDWSASKTGLINPVAVFSPVELGGSTVHRASLHNLSYIKQLNLNIGDTITVYKANMIIPQIDENLTGSSCGIHFPSHCPACGEKTKCIKGKNEDSEFLFCTNPDCPAKHIGRFERLVDRNGLNVVGLSKATLQTLLNEGMIKYPADIFHLAKFKNKIIALDGFGEKSYDNLISSIENARSVSFQAFFYSLSIPGTGHDVAKKLDDYFNENLKTCQRKSLELFKLCSFFPQIDGIGEITWSSIKHWFAQHEDEYFSLCDELLFVDDVITEKNIADGSKTCKELSFVVTGSLNHFKNRAELKSWIELHGGKISGTVSKKTDFLINNDTDSTSAKNKKAKELNIPILSEQDFLDKFYR